MSISGLTQNRRTWFFIGVIGLAITGILLFHFVLHKEEALYLAIAGPMSGEARESGTAMVRGAKLALDQVNRAGGVRGRRVKLLVYDDQNDPELARLHAHEIVRESRALAVLGHLFSSTTIAAGDVYRDGGIVAISGSATSDRLTQDNDWFFRTIYNDRSQAALLGYYAKRVLGHRTAGIIYDQDTYGDSLMKGFERSFRAAGGKVKYKWHLDPASDGYTAMIADTVHALLILEAQQTDLDVIFLATHPTGSVELLTQMKRKGLTYPLLAGDALGEPIFAKRFERYREEQVTPGYFTDGLYATSPIIFDVAGNQAQQFYRTFAQTYGEPPGWTAATYHDAALMALEAIRRSWDEEVSDLKTSRRRLRHALSKINKADEAVEGVTGPLYFDHHGDIESVVVVGVFEQQRFISATKQMYPVTNLRHPGVLERQWQEEAVTLINGKYMHQTNVVYTGIDLNRVQDIKRNGSAYTMDFYLWFRSHQDIDPTNIAFVNVQNEPGKETSVALKKPVAESIENGIAYRAYRLKQTFIGSFNLRDYPFDTQQISIQFRHANLTRNRIVYVTDVIGMGDLSQPAILNKFKSTNVFESISDWQISGAHFFQDTMHTQSTLGSPERLDQTASIDYSRFNLVIDIKRELSKFIAKSLLPVMFVISLAYLAFFLPIAYGETLIAMLTGTVISVVFFHSDLSKQLDVGYAVALDYAFYVIYGLLVFELIIGILMVHRNEERALKRLMLTGKVVYPLVMLTTAASLYVIYVDAGDAHHHHTASGSTALMSAAPDHSDHSDANNQTVLTLSSWRTDDIEQVNRVLDEFHTLHPHITIRYEPVAAVEYRHMLQHQLDNGFAPDLFYLLPYGRGRALFDGGHLDPLDDLAGLRKYFTSQAREPWATDTGRPYGVPVFTIALGIFYNMTLFEEHNLTFPTTWEGLLKTAEALRALGIIPFANASKTPLHVADDLFLNMAPIFIGGREGRLQYARGERCFNDPHTVAVFEAVQALAPHLPASHRDMTYYESEQLFFQGRAAMWLTTSTEMLFLELAGPSFEWRLSGIPAPSNMTDVVVVDPYAAIGLNSASPHKAEAKMFLKWLTTPDAAAVILRELPGFLSPNRAAPAPQHLGMQQFLAHLETRQTDVVWVWPRLMAGEPAGFTLLEEISPAVLNGEITPQQGANRFQQGLSQWFEPAQRCAFPNLPGQEGFEERMRQFINRRVNPDLQRPQVTQAVQQQNARLASLSPEQIGDMGESWRSVTGQDEPGDVRAVRDHALSDYLRSLVQQSRSLYTSLTVFDANGLPVGISRMPSDREIASMLATTQAPQALEVSPIQFDRASERWHLRVSWPLIDPERLQPIGGVMLGVNPTELETQYCWHNPC